VNGGSGPTVSLTGANLETVVSTTVDVNLSFGANTLRFFNNSAIAPDLDRIVLTAGSATPTATPTSTPTATATPTPSPTRTPTSTPTATSTPTVTPTPTSTPTPTVTPTPRPTGTPTGNLALNKPADGSAPCNANEGPEKAFNGSVSGGGTDKWCSQANAKFLQVDLGGTFTLTWFVVRHAGAGGEGASLNTRHFDIETSVDGVTFTRVMEVRNNTAGVSTVGITPRAARYVRLNVLMAEQTTDNAARIYEFEVYGGTGGPAPTPPTPTPTPTPTPGPICGTVNGRQYLRVYQSPLSNWCVESNLWAAHSAEVQRFFPYGDSVVTTLGQLFAFTPRGLPFTFQASEPTGFASTGSDFGLGVTVTGDAFYNNFRDPVSGTLISGFWGYLLTLHEAVNVWTGEMSGGGWPTDWWADHRSPFPNSMDYHVMKHIGDQQNDANLQAAALAQHRRFTVPGQGEFDTEVVMFDTFFDRYGGFPAYARVFDIIQKDGLRWPSVAPNPSPLLSEYVMAYLSIGFGSRVNLTSEFVAAGVGTKDTQIPPYTVSADVVTAIADAHCSIVAATGSTTAALAALRRGDYVNARVPSTCSTRCPSTTTCACDTVTNTCVAPWAGR
jgi:hypothetical protein